MQVPLPLAGKHMFNLPATAKLGKEIETLSTRIVRRPEDAEAHLQRGIFLRRFVADMLEVERITLLKTALADLESANDLSGSQGLPRALAEASIVAYELYDLPKAADLARRAVEAAPHDVRAQAVAVFAPAAVEGKWSAAADQLSKLATSAKGPDAVLAWELVGQCAWWEGNSRRAERAYRCVLELDAAHPTAKVLLVNELLSQGQADEAKKLLEPGFTIPTDQVLNANDHSVMRLGQLNPHQQTSMLVHLLQLVPEFALGWRNLGLQLQTMGERERARATMQKALALVPLWPDVMLDLASLYQEMGQTKDAQAMLEAAAELAPDDPRLLLTRGHALLRQGKAEEAEQVFRRAVEVAPDLRDGWRVLGWLLWQKGHAQEGEAMIRRALQLDPLDAASQCRLATMLIARNALDEAQRQLTDAEQYAPKLADVPFGFGLLWARRGDEDKALEHFRKASQLDPSHVLSRQQLGRLLMRRGRYDEVVAEMTDLLAHAPTDASAFFSRGQAHLSALRPEMVAADLTRALEFGQDNAIGPVRAARGVAHLMLGAQREAIADLRAVLERDPRNGFAALWLWDVHSASGQTAEAAEVLATALKSVERDSWEYDLIRFHRGGVSEKALVEAAADDGARCEAYYYIGRKAQLAGRAEEARQAYDRCVETNQLEYTEHTLARWWLEHSPGP